MASSYVQKVIRSVKKNNPHQPEFIQALEEVLHSLEPLFLKDPKSVSYTHLDVYKRQVSYILMLTISDRGLSPPSMTP